PLIERLGQVENQIREHQNSLRTIISDLSVRDRSAAEQLNVLRVERARLINEEFAKQRTQLNAVRGELARLTREEFAKQATQLNALQAELVQVTNERFTKQATQFDAVLRAIEALPNRSEIKATDTRLVSLEQALVRLEQLIAALHQKLDIVANRFFFPVDDDTVLVRCFVDYVYCSRNDHAVLANINDGGGFEPGLRRLLERVLEPCMVFLDVGAHLGLHTLAAARRIGKTGRVFCFEPTPVTYELLCRTLRLNGLDDRVTARCAAAGREDTTKPLHVSTISSHNSLYPLPNAETTVQVEVVRLDDEMPAGQRVDVAKIDVEGAELDVLCGMARIIAENPGILIIAEYGPSHLVRTGIAPEDWLATFSDQGFEAYVIEEPSGNCVPIQQVDLSDVFSVNIAFVRSTSRLRLQLSANTPTRPPVVVIGAGGHAKVVI